MNRADVGARGEQVAARYLRKKGFDILERNIHLSHQEIDIIAINKQYIVFAEVKTRVMSPDDANMYNAPAAAVTYRKQEYLLRAARKYLSDNRFKAQPRMDVIEVYLAPDDTLTKSDRFWERMGGWFGPPARKVLKINHIENAFGAHRRRTRS